MSEYITFNTTVQQAHNPHKCSGFGLGYLLKDKQNPIGVEIGCSEADTTKFLLDVNPSLKITSIDPYVNYVDWNGRQLNDRQEFFESVMRKLAPYSDRFTMIRDFSDNVVDTFEDESLDFIFIDGLHTYEQVKKDCENYYSKVKPGCIFAGHDYTAIEGVNRAVVEFAKSVGKQILTTECDVWYWYK
jgi:hypothetical protein